MHHTLPLPFQRTSCFSRLAAACFGLLLAALHESL